MASLYLLETSIVLNWRVYHPNLSNISTRGDNPFNCVLLNMNIILLKHAGHARTVWSPVTLLSLSVQSLYQKTEAPRTVVTQHEDAPIQRQNCFERTDWGLFLDPEKLIPCCSMLHQGLYWKCNHLEMHQNITKYRQLHPLGWGAQ